VSDRNNVLPGVAIRLGKDNVTLTNARGEFTITVGEGSYVLECRMIGYKTISRKVQVVAGSNKTIDILMEEDLNPMEEIVVSAEKYEQKLGEVTVSMEVLKPSLLQNKNSTSLDQAIAQVPGVTVADGQVSIRGGSGFSYGAGSRVLMLMDEIPMISADAGDIKWNYMPIENLEQVEVLKGSSSVLYGSGALNGVVNFRTAFAREKPQTQASIYYGRYDSPRHVYKWWDGSSQTQRGINFSHAQKIKNLDLVIGAHKFNDDGYRYLETEMRDRFNTSLKYNFKKIPELSAGLNLNMMNVRGGLFFLWQNYDSAYIPQGRTIQQYNNNRFNADPWIVWNSMGDSTKRFSVSFRNRYFKTENRNDKNQNSYAELYYSELQGRKRFRHQLDLTAGFVFMKQLIFGDSIYGAHLGHNLAGYLQVMKKTGNLTLSAGVRGEFYKIDTAKTTGYLFRNNEGMKLPFQPVLRLGANYQLARLTYLRASFGQGYRFPSAAEKFVNTSVSILKIFPNPSLQPERAYSAELSIKQGFRIGEFHAYADLAAFYTRYYDMIEFVFDVYKPGGATGNLGEDLAWAGFKSQNIGNAEISGAELSINGSGMVGPVKATLLTGYTYINPIQPGYDPKRDTLGLEGVNTLKYRSRHLYKADIQLEYKWISIGYSARYQSRIENIDRRFVQSVLHEYNTPFFNFDNQAWTYVLPGLKENYGAFSKGVWVHDARIGFQVSRMVKVSFIVNNIFNVEYQSRPGDVRPPTLYMGQVLIKI
jgi:outer membrane receptor protein involved in Fe transport